MNIRINIRAATFNIMILSTINLRDLKQLEPLVDVEKSFSKVGTLKNELGSEFILRISRFDFFSSLWKMFSFFFSSESVIDSSSQFYLYRNFIHLLFPDQVKIFFGQNN